MNTIYDWKLVNYGSIDEDSIWSDEKPSLKMHSIHAYPAKFPAFLASAGIEYAKKEGVYIRRVADVFCGCGTTALEAKVQGYSFWGCDINPVATLIARVKGEDYRIDWLKKLFRMISERYSDNTTRKQCYYEANERLKYWFWEEQYNELYCLYNSIIETTTSGKYRDAFLCIFSSILKRTSKWLQKSIKPQVDPYKQPRNVWDCFEKKFFEFCDAILEMKNLNIMTNNDIVIENKSLFNTNESNIDLILTSPPYVTSYEYADLHQLSILWLEYENDYRKLREGSVGSSYDVGTNMCNERVNMTASSIVNALRINKCTKSKIGSVVRYYRDIENTVNRCWNMLNNKGMIVFVIGDSMFRGVKLENSRHLLESMIKIGFDDIKISRRRISKGICVPYRNESGRFTKKNSCKNEVYHEEFIVSGRKYE